MKPQIMLGAVAILLVSACEHTSNLASINPMHSKINQSDAEIASCVRTIMKLDEGRWAYMGTIARLSGTFRTYAATSVHASAGTDMWASKAFGGDVGGNEADAELGYVKLVGTSIVPLVDGELNETAAVKYTSCVGPDTEGRYQATTEYKMPNGDGTFDTSYTVNWYSKHGSYYAEDHFNEDGKIVSRRSGVNTPIEE